MMNENWRKLAQAVVNPNYDGRCRYGMKQYPTFEEGELFSVLKRHGEASVLLYRGHLEYIRQELVDELETKSDSHTTPETWEEAQKMLDAKDWLASATIERLIAEGKVSIEDAYTTAKRVLLDWGMT